MGNYAKLGGGGSSKDGGEAERWWGNIARGNTKEVRDVTSALKGAWAHFEWGRGVEVWGGKKRDVDFKTGRRLDCKFV